MAGNLSGFHIGSCQAILAFTFTTPLCFDPNVKVKTSVVLLYRPDDRTVT